MVRVTDRPECATCDGTGIVYPPATFGQGVPDDAGDECADCFGTGLCPVERAS